MDSSPSISVIIPVYNTEPYLPDCIDSILSQDLRDIEVICVDDGSTDGSLDVLRRYEQQDARVQVIHQDNAGQSAARDRGLDAARGQYLYFCDSDDMLDKDVLGELYRQCAENRLDILYFDASLVFDSPALEQRFAADVSYFQGRAGIRGVHSGLDMMARLWEREMYRVSPCLQLLNAAFLRGAGIRFREGIIHEDEAFTFVTMLHAQRTMKLDKCCYLRRYREDSVMTVPNAFRNVYGYYVSLMTALAAVQGVPMAPPHQQAVGKTLQWLRDSVRGRYAQLSPQEQSQLERLEPLDRIGLDMVLGATGAYEAVLIRSSASFRIGQAVTWLPRKLRGALGRGKTRNG